MELLYDTNSKLGVISSKRAFIIESPDFNNLIAKYARALNDKNSAQVASVEKQLQTKWYKRTISSGEVAKIHSAKQLETGTFPGADKLSAEVKWYSEEGGLRVVANVIDANFTTKAPATAPWQGSCVEIMLAPRVTRDSVIQELIIPAGENGKAKQHVGYPGISATWKRTAKGYTVDAKIAWSQMPGYNESMSILPVQLAIDGITAKGRVVRLMMNGSSDPYDSREFALLKLRK